MSDESSTWSDLAVVEAVRDTTAAQPEPDDFDEAFEAHAAYTESLRADVRLGVRAAQERIAGIREDIGRLEENDCCGDCCGSSSDRAYALEFLLAAEQSLAAAHGLMRHAWRGDGAR